jgi:hypothetical protein
MVAQPVCPISHSGGHWNPVTAGFVTERWHWKHSSTVDYMTGEKRLLDIIFLE